LKKTAQFEVIPLAEVPVSARPVEDIGAAKKFAASPSQPATSTEGTSPALPKKGGRVGSQGFRGR
jgi:hypothetical protein